MYVLRSGYEEAKILWRREPISRMLARSDLDGKTRAKLELVLAVREFARDKLKLRVGGSYASYARVDENQIVYVVTAAERFRLQAYTWWFPIVGRVPYKGYFDKQPAEAEAAKLEEEGYDTLVRPSAAFSTLGWFDDPLLSTVLSYDEVTLAEVVIHELLHNTTYVPGHADFDESFANFVGNRGAIAFFAARDDVSSVELGTLAWQDSLAFSEFLGRNVERLRREYNGGLTRDSRTRVFQEMQDEFRTLPWRTEIYRSFGSRPLNNAVILHYLVYGDRLQLFERLWQQQGEDLGSVIQQIRDATDVHRDDPFAAVERLIAPPAATTAGR